MTAVRLRSAEVRIEGRAILGPVELEVGDGEHWVLLGPNGCGKTTMLSLMGAWRQPSRGAVEVLGERLGRTDVRRLRRRVGHVSHLLLERIRPSITAGDAVLAGRAAALETWWQDLGENDRAAARAALTAVGCDRLEHRRLGSLSLGERARVGIARAMVGDPDLLLFDEPAAGLDLPSRERLLAAMVAVAASPRAPVTVLATHHLEEIPHVATHAALLREGRLTAAGPIRDVLTDDRLSACLGLSVRVGAREGRWWATAAPA